MKFEIFAGLGGSFNNETSMGIEEFDSIEEARDAAYEDACDAYDNVSGTHGLRSQEEIVLSLKEAADYAGVTEDEQEEEAWEVYDDEREGWLKCHVVEVIE